jgi:hypothetical protein
MDVPCGVEMLACLYESKGSHKIHFSKLVDREPGLENRDYGSRDPSRRPRGTLHPQKYALISLTSGGRSVGIFRSRTQATEF